MLRKILKRFFGKLKKVRPIGYDRPSYQKELSPGEVRYYDKRRKKWRSNK